MTPYYADDLVTIYHGDCREVLPSLDPVGGVVTSPPYNLGDMSGGYANLDGGYASYTDQMPHVEYVEWQRAVLSDLWRLIREDGAIFYNHKPRIRDGLLWLPLELNPGLPLRQIIIWTRGGGMNWSETHLVPSHEWVMLFAKPRFRFSKTTSNVGDVWSVQQTGGAERMGHPAPFPLGLARRAVDLIAEANDGAILDPFAGSGTTLLAAKEASRKSIGYRNRGTLLRDRRDSLFPRSARPRRMRQTTVVEVRVSTDLPGWFWVVHILVLLLVVAAVAWEVLGPVR